MTTLLVATRNAHKVEEISHIMGDGFRCLSVRDFPGAPEVVEDKETFAGNAAKKVLSLAEWLVRTPNPKFESMPAEGAFYVLADDSGLEVDALNGSPGVHSARFAATDPSRSGNTSDAANNAKLLRLLNDVPDSSRTARFRCILALLPIIAESKSGRDLPVTAGQIVLFDGACEGRISRTPSGGGGFGYDPLFVPDGHTHSFAELGSDVKNSLSHRSRALAKMRPFLQGGNSRTPINPAAKRSRPA